MELTSSFLNSERTSLNTSDGTEVIGVKEANIERQSEHLGSVINSDMDNDDDREIFSKTSNKFKNINKKNKHSRIKRLFDDSDDEDDLSRKENVEEIQAASLRVLSDSEEEIVVADGHYDEESERLPNKIDSDLGSEQLPKKMDNDKDSDQENERLPKKVDSDEDSEFRVSASRIESESEDEVENLDHKGRLRTESEDEDVLNVANQVLSDLTASQVKEPTKVSLKEKGMEKKQIYSESQKRIRNEAIYLPYHRPKRHSLDEFLSRSTKNSQQFESLKRIYLKTNMKNLEVLRQLEARKKELVDFYKSDDEGDNDSDEDYTPEDKLKRKSSPDTAAEELNAYASSEQPSIDNIHIEIKCLENAENIVEKLTNESDYAGSECINEEPSHDLTILDSAFKNIQSVIKTDEINGVENKANELPHLVHNYHSANCELTQQHEMSVHSHVYNSDTPLENSEIVTSETRLLENCSENIEEQVNAGIEKIVRRSLNSAMDAEVPVAGEVPSLILEDDHGDDSELGSLMLFDGEDSHDSEVPSHSTLKSIQNLTPNLARLIAKFGCSEAFDSAVHSNKSPQIGACLKYSENIDLDDDSGGKISPGLSNLIHRFAKHSTTVRPPKKSEVVNLSVVSKERDCDGQENLVSSNVPYMINNEKQNEMLICETPGRKLQILKSSLREKIYDKRYQSMRERQMNKNFLENESVEQDIDDPFALPEDDEDDNDANTDSEGETESEPEEDDIPMVDSKREKNAFIESEAEESDEEVDADVHEQSDLDDSDDESGDDSDQAQSSDGELVVTRKKNIKGSKPKMALVLDSDEEIDNATVPSLNGATVEVYSSSVDSFLATIESSKRKDVEEKKEAEVGGEEELPATIRLATNTPPPSSGLKLESLSSEDSFVRESSILAHQPLLSTQPLPPSVISSTDACDGFNFQRSNTVVCPPLDSSQDLLWCSVDTSKTNTLLSSSRYSRPNLDEVQSLGSQDLCLDFPGDFTQTPRASTSELSVLFSDVFKGTHSAGLEPSQFDLSSLMGMCTGGFSASNAIKNNAPQSLKTVDTPSCVGSLDDTVVLKKSCEATAVGYAVTPSAAPPAADVDNELVDDDLLDLCSGDFDISTKNKRAKTLKGQSKLTSFFNRELQPKHACPSAQEDAVKESESGAVPDSSTIIEATNSKSSSGNVVNDRSDENDDNGDDELEDLGCDVGEKARRRIILLDDNEESDTEVKIQDEAAEDSDTEESDDEVPETPKKRMVIFDDNDSKVRDEEFAGFRDRKGIREEFLEKEAELSGSEVDSDEDDRDEDDLMDEEEGDKEYFDEDQLREEVGRTHHRGQLAQDQREVRLLQELYLEDGDLHGEGRQRTFRWKHLENNIETDARTASDDEGDDANNEDEEENVKWRQQRFEREQFLKQAKELETDNDEPVNSASLLKSSSLPVFKSVRGSSLKLSARNKKPLQVSNPEGGLVKQASLPQNSTMCGSFLSRGSSKLAKLAALLKDPVHTSGIAAVTAKASGNFVFQMVSEDEARNNTEMLLNDDNSRMTKLKRRIAPSTGTVVTKKPRLETPQTSSLNSSIFRHL